jgi:hypothetical protein
MIRNSQAASSTVLPLIVIVMEVVSSKDFDLWNSTLFVVGQKTEAVNNRSTV